MGTVCTKLTNRKYYRHKSSFEIKTKSTKVQKGTQKIPSIMILMILWLAVMGTNLPMTVASPEARLSNYSPTGFKGQNPSTNTQQNTGKIEQKFDEVDFPDSAELNGNPEIYDYGQDFDCDNDTEAGENACSSGEFACYSGKCIPNAYVCNGINDCGDKSDEQDCGCSLDEFKCTNGDCIPISYKCNEYEDCMDKSDEEEEMCTKQGCDSSEFSCNNGECVSLAKQCDGVNDCTDNTDELGCAKICKSTEFTCKNGNCINSGYRCNNVNNCGDSSDEEGCNCQSDEFTCDNGNCISEEYECNNANNCGDGSDEIGCHCETPYYFACAEGNCKTIASQCNGVNDCGDWSDEAGCPCASHLISCSNGLCVNPDDKCDGNNDCGDWTDEQGCGKCDESEIKCGNGNCISTKYECDGQDNCGDYTDESDCGGCIWADWEGVGTCDEPCGEGEQAMMRSESPWGNQHVCTGKEYMTEICVLSGCTAIEIDQAIDDTNDCLYGIDGEILLAMDASLEELQETADKVEMCEDYFVIFNARASLVTQDEQNDHSIKATCEQITGETSRDDKVSKDRSPRTRMDNRNTREIKSETNSKPTTLNRMKRRANDGNYEIDNEGDKETLEEDISMDSMENQMQFAFGNTVGHEAPLDNKDIMEAEQGMRVPEGNQATRIFV